MKFSTLITLCLFLSIPATVYAFSYTKEISQKEMQNILDKKFPIKKKKFMISATLSDPTITFIGKNNRIGIEMNVKFKFPARLSGAGKINMDGSLRYDNKSGSFYFDNLKINKLTVVGLDNEKTNTVKSLLEPIAQKSLAEFPVYKFKNDLKNKLAKAALKSIKVEKELLLIELGIF